MARRPLPLSLLIGAILLLLAPATGGAAATVEAEGQEIGGAAMVSGTSGWANTGAGLYWTDDGGASWRDITPAQARLGRVSSVDFADPEHGWAVAEEGDEAHARPSLYATSDGGRHWTRFAVPLPPYAQLTGASFSAVGAHLVFALVRQSSDPALSLAHLFVSHDGGRSWREVQRRPPGGGEISFSTARDGWLAKDVPAPALYRTRDGGRTWQEVKLPGLATARVELLAPRFEADGHGILACHYARRGRGVSALYSTADFGRHWKLAASARLTGRHPGIVAVAVDGNILAYRGGESALAPIYTAPRLGLLSVDGSVSPLAGTGLPEYPASISFSGSENGFALIESGSLYFTSDGGASWTPVSPP